MASKKGGVGRQVRLPEDVIHELETFRIGDESYGSVIRRLLTMRPCPHDRGIA